VELDKTKKGGVQQAVRFITGLGWGGSGWVLRGRKWARRAEGFGRA